MSQYSLYRHSYPDPFLDQASTKLPKSQKKLFEMLHIFSTTHPQIRPIVHKLAKYPITNVIVDTEQDSLRKKWKDALEMDLRIYEVAEGMGLDYMGYGNVFITIHKPFVRSYSCNSCGHDHPAGGDLKYYIKGSSVIGSCTKCGARTSFKAHDNYTSAAEDIAIVRIPPKEMMIKVNRSTNRCEYFRTVPPELKQALKKEQKPDRFIIDTTPWKYVEAAMKNKKIRYGKNRILHFREPTLSEHNSHWGMPIIMAALKDAYLNQIYKKADETVANERAVPARFVYPQMTSQDPMRMIGLSKWSTYMHQVIRRRRHDPNAVLPVPFPVGVAEVGGDAQRLTTANLRQLVIREIVGSTGVPEGFLSDGMTYSGGTVQARMLENMIKSYLRSLDILIRFVVRETALITGWPEVDVRWKPFSKVDDIQVLQILMQLLQMGHVSGREILDRLDLDWESQHDIILDETEKIQEVRLKESLTQTRAMLEGVDMQVSAQKNQQSTSDMIDEMNQNSQEVMEQLLAPKAQEVPEDGYPPIVRSIAGRLMYATPEERNQTLEDLAEKAPEIASQVREMLHMNTMRDDVKSPKDLANKIVLMPRDLKVQAFSKLREEDPQLAMLVMKEIANMSGHSSANSPKPSTSVETQPTQRPPRRL